MAPNPDPANTAHAILERLFWLLQDCRAAVPQPERGPEGETEKDAAERLTYYGILGAIEEGLVNTAEHTVTVLRSAEPLGPMGEEWLRRQQNQVRGDQR